MDGSTTPHSPSDSQSIDFNKKNLEKFILYLDANNLYGCAQTLPLPMKNYQWAETSKSELIKNFFDMRTKQLKRGKVPTGWKDFFGETNIGYFLKVDLKYPKHLHYLHRDYPLAPENVRISKVNLSPTQVKLAEKLNIDHASGGVKLCPNLSDREQYVLHHSVLDLYTRLGLVVSKIHEVLQFEEGAFLKQWVDKCTKVKHKR